MKTLDVIAAVILVLGGLGWGLVATAQIDIVGVILADLGGFGRAAYAVVGLAAMYQALSWRAIQKRWALAWAKY
jgi:uncharacterized membrane protein YuzA (DUF378 family)